MYSDLVYIQSHTVGVDIVKACGDSGGTSNRENLIVTILSYVSEVDVAGGGRDFSRLEV